MAAYDPNGPFAFNTVVHFLVQNPKFDYRYILGLLNSKLFSFYAYKFIYNNAIRSMDFYEDYAGRLPVKSISIDSQEEIVNIVDSIISHFKHPSRCFPDYKKYLTEKIVGFKELITYYRKLEPTDRDPKDLTTVGRIKKLIVREDGSWLSFRVDYVDEEKQKIISDYEVLRCKINDRPIRIFLQEEINSRNPPNRGKRLLDKILSAKVASFHHIHSKDKESITLQLTPFLRDLDKHILWEKEYKDLDDKLNNCVYEIYGLNAEEIKYLEDNSKASGWHSD